MGSRDNKGYSQQKRAIARAIYNPAVKFIQDYGLHIFASLLFLLSFFMISQQANAGLSKDIPADFSLKGSANQAFGALNAYPAILNSSEQQSHDLSAFTKWSQMFDRFERDMATYAHDEDVQSWRVRLSMYEGLPISQMAERVNNMVNEVQYVTDGRNWGTSDYWATPVEFITRGAGDCEDFAIAKYASLRALGVPEQRLRLAIVHDEVKDIPHAVLIVYTESGPVILDNQIKHVIDGSDTGRYRPIYSINRTAWWLHKAPSATRVAAHY